MTENYIYNQASQIQIFILRYLGVNCMWFVEMQALSDNQ